jgi:Flp pilus assembly protein TadD
LAAFSEGNFEEALAAANRSIRAVPEFWVPRLRLGAVLLIMGRPDEALPELDKCAALNPESNTCLGLRSAPTPGKAMAR